MRVKQSTLCERFRQSFEEIIFTIHPSGVEGEIPGTYLASLCGGLKELHMKWHLLGKCSNVNCGIRTGISHMKKVHGSSFNPDMILITNGDSDNKFHPKYLEALTYKFLTSKDRGSCLYQVNWKSHKRKETMVGLYCFAGTTAVQLELG